VPGSGASASVRRLVAAAALTGAVFLTTPVTENRGGFDFDGVFYGAMAGSPLIDPLYARIAPWCYRVLTPALVRALPLDTLAAFRAVVFVSDVASLCVLFAILRRIRASGGLAEVGVLLYAGVFWTLKFSFYSPAYIDAESQLALLTIVYLTVSRRYVWLIPVLGLSALQKESLVAFALFPAARLLREGQGRLDRRRAALVASMLVVMAAALIAARALVPAVNGYSAAQTALVEMPRGADAAFWPMLAQSVFSGLGLLPIVIALEPRPALRLLRQEYEWIVYAGISLALLFGGVDKARLFLYALPLAVAMAMRSVEGIEARLGGSRTPRPVDRRRFAAWVLALLTLHLFIGNYLTPIGTFAQYLARLVPEHSNGAYLPYLARNAGLALSFVLATLVLARRPTIETAPSP
jgi:hypothetical protein